MGTPPPSHPRPEPLLSDRGGDRHVRFYQSSSSSSSSSSYPDNPHSFTTTIASILFHLGREVVDHVRSIRLPTHVLPGCAPTHRRTTPLKHSTAPDTPVVTF